MRGWIQQAGGKVDLQLKDDLPMPEPLEGEVLIRNAFACINPVDWKRVNANPCAFPSVPGVDGAGVIVAVGANVEGFRVGDRVNYHCNFRKENGSFAQYSVAQVGGIGIVPTGVSLEAAASTPCAQWTAYVGLFQKLSLAKGDTVLILGGAGGVGNFAVQMAARVGTTVITTCSAASAAAATQAGATYTIDYRTENVVERINALTHGKGVAKVFDTIGDKTTWDVLPAVQWRGTIATVLAVAIPDAAAFQQKEITVSYIALGRRLITDIGRRELAEIAVACNAMLLDGRVKPVATVVPFEEVNQGMEQSAKGVAKGKIVIRIAGEL